MTLAERDGSARRFVVNLVGLAKSDHSVDQGLAQDSNGPTPTASNSAAGRRALDLPASVRLPEGAEVRVIVEGAEPFEHEPIGEGSVLADIAWATGHRFDS